MFEKIPAPPDVLAYQVKGQITALDIDTIYDELSAALTKRDKLGVYVEMIDDFDMAGDAVWRDVRRAPELFGRFRKFDRVALVAKPSWITRIAKLEEAVLSLFKFDMHVFDPSERERAMAWVKGEVQGHDKPSIRELPSDDPTIAIYEVDGKIRKQDVPVAKDILRKFLDDNEPRRLLGIIKDFDGFEISLVADKEALKLKLEAAKHLDRYAFVGAPKWLEGYISMMDGLLKTKLRTFNADQRDEALAWLKEDELVA